MRSIRDEKLTKLTTAIQIHNYTQCNTRKDISVIFVIHRIYPNQNYEQNIVGQLSSGSQYSYPHLYPSNISKLVYFITLHCEIYRQ